MYGWSQRGASAENTGTPASAPAAAAAEPPAPLQPAPAPAVAAVVPTAVPAGPTGEAPSAAPANSAEGPVARAAHAVAPARARGDAPVAAPQPPKGEGADQPVISVQPAQAVEDEPDVAATVAAAADKPASTMDALLDEALSPKARRDELAARQQAALEANALPATPSREDVTQAMTVLLPAIRGCAQGQSGMAIAGIVVHSDGRVASVDVAGAPFAGNASGRCMEGVLRRARFPRFTQPSFRIRFPLAIQ
jgi:pyruvate dehydrogenase E2 component (dihydrolipoamide acetyltransferase)